MSKLGRTEAVLKVTDYYCAVMASVLTESGYVRLFVLSAAESNFKAALSFIYGTPIEAFNDDGSIREYSKYPKQEVLIISSPSQTPEG